MGGGVDVGVVKGARGSHEIVSGVNPPTTIEWLSPLGQSEQKTFRGNQAFVFLFELSA
jgi:hypothetical protein